MRVILQRVSSAKLTSGEYESSIGGGLLALIGVGKGDTDYDAKYLARRVANLRIFEDSDGKSNLSILDTHGEILCVSNFTLLAVTKKGTRPDYFEAAGKEEALRLYELFVEEIKKYITTKVAKGSFGNHMDIECTLNGPFTITLESVGRENE